MSEITDEFRTARTAALARYGELLTRFKAQCQVEGDEIRAARSMACRSSM